MINENSQNLHKNIEETEFYNQELLKNESEINFLELVVQMIYSQKEFKQIMEKTVKDHNEEYSVPQFYLEYQKEEKQLPVLSAKKLEKQEKVARTPFK